MSFEFLAPVSDLVAAHTKLLSDHSLGKQIKIHTAKAGVPDLEKIDIAILGIQENRNDVNFLGEKLNFDSIRTSLYEYISGGGT